MSETATLLQELIRFDTTNPPGNEEACVAHIEALLNAHDIETERYEKVPGPRTADLAASRDPPADARTVIRNTVSPTIVRSGDTIDVIPIPGRPSPISRSSACSPT